jgi:ferredoxin
MKNLNRWVKSLILHNEYIDILRVKWVKRVVIHRAFQWAVIVPNLFVFWFLITAGFVGSPVGNMNISITFVWMLWWFALIAILVPFLARGWCTICPLPIFGEWLQRKSMIKKTNYQKPLGLNLNWPGRFRNIWLQNIGFLSLASFSVLLVSRPIVTSLVLGGLFIISTVLMLFYSKRAFCRYVCPVGGFIGLFSMFSSIELRVKDRQLCKKHITKECIRGSDISYGCPWFEYPGNMDRNAYCGLCFECVKACPFDNIRLNARGFGRDLLVSKGKGLDEAWKVFIMLSLAGVYVAVMQGPWGWLRDWANVFYSPPYGFALTGLNNYIFYLAIVWGLSLAIVPALFYVTAAISKYFSESKHSVKDIFTGFSYELVPLALMAWIAFSIPIIQVNWSYILNTISDPFGWGWNLLGTKNISWNPIFPGLIPYEQLIILLIGLYYSIKTGYKLAAQYFDRNVVLRGFLPQLVFIVIASSTFAWLFLG